jgi:hypothetical protein
MYLVAVACPDVTGGRSCWNQGAQRTNVSQNTAFTKKKVVSSYRYDIARPQVADRKISTVAANMLKYSHGNAANGGLGGAGILRKEETGCFETSVH